MRSIRWGLALPVFACAAALALGGCSSPAEESAGTSPPAEQTASAPAEPGANTPAAGSESTPASGEKTEAGLKTAVLNASGMH